MIWLAAALVLVAAIAGTTLALCVRWALASQERQAEARRSRAEQASIEALSRRVEKLELGRVGSRVA